MNGPWQVRSSRVVYENPVPAAAVEAEPVTLPADPVDGSDVPVPADGDG